MAVKAQPPISRACWFFGFCAAVLLVLGLYAAYAWNRIHTKNVRAASTVLAAFPDAFGSNGTFQADFDPEYEHTCKEMLLVEQDTAGLTTTEVESMLEGLQATVSISDLSGRLLLNTEITGESFGAQRADPDGDTLLNAFFFNPVPRGHYRITLTVHAPAPRLIDCPHRVVAKYTLCGIEHIAGWFAGGVALALLALSLVAGLAMRMCFRSKPRQNHVRLWTNQGI